MTTHKNAARKIFPFIALLLFGFSATAQIKYGFKTGLNFARFSGDSEIDDAGKALETWSNVTGFHIGMTFSHNFTDQFGVRGEFLYSKRGAKYAFEGQSYRIFKHSTGEVLTLGTSRYLINVNNSYLDIPLMAYGRFGDFEISGGGYIGVLVQSSGEGSLRYSGKTALGNDVFDNLNNNKDLSFNLNHNYRRDDPGEGSARSDDESPVNVKVDAFVSETPKTMGAYYDYPAGAGRLYNSFDYGLVGGVSYYISRALYLSVRVQYGLGDVTNNAADLAKARVGSNGELLFRDDKDRNFAIQTTVGFSF